MTIFAVLWDTQNMIIFREVVSEMKFLEWKDYVDSHIFGGMSRATAELQPLPKIQRFKFGKMVFYYQQAVKPFTFLCEVQVNILCCGLDSNHILVQFNTRPSKKEDYRSPYFQLKFPLDHRRLGDHQILLDHSSPYFYLKWPVHHHRLGDHQIKDTPNGSGWVIKYYDLKSQYTICKSINLQEGRLTKG